MEAVSRPALEQGVAQGGVLFDVRPVSKLVFGLVAERLELAAVQRGELPELGPDTPLYLVCERGQVSELAGLYLETAGFTQVFHLAGGLHAWPD